MNPRQGDLALWKSIAPSSLRDTLSDRTHSRDFAFARAEYLRSRVLIVGLIFLVLSPFWAIIDSLVLPDSARTTAAWGRVAMVAGLTATVLLVWRSPQRIPLARAGTGLLIGLPAAFYALVLAALPAGQANTLVGYSFIPYMLTVMLSIFPLTLIESAIFGLALLLLQAFAVHVSGEWLTLRGIQELWLLAALLCITLTTNHFHLGLLLRLYREATHDSLTGLLNRGALIQTVEQARRLKNSQPIAVLMMDLDHFKRINDQYGHSVGDKVLRQFAQLLRQNIRSSDIGARYGGEEFMAVLMRTSKEQAMGLAERLRQQVETTLVEDHQGNTFNFTVSIGVATLYPDEALEVAGRRADDRLYEAKKISRNCVVGV